jgi:hypothetical protein
MNKPSGWFVALCITAIVIGSLGILTGLYGLAMLAVGRTLQEKLEAAQSVGPAAAQMAKQLEVRREMQKQIQEVVYRWRWITMPLLAVNLAVSLGLIVGGAGSLRLRPRGRTLLWFACWAAIVLELARLGPTLVIQKETLAVTSRYMSRLMEVSAPPGQKMPAEAGEIAGVFMKVAAIGAIVVGVVLALAKVGLYAFGVIYLRRRDVRILFEPPVTAEVSS